MPHTEMSNIIAVQDLTAKVKQLKELEAFADEINAEIETIKDELKKHMEAAQAEEMTVDVFKVRYKTVTSARFDSATFKSTHAELYNQYSKPTVTRRFTVA